MASTEPPVLIVNADDYGYFRCVSYGILEAAGKGIVTATGVIANREGLEQLVPQLRSCTTLDAGVHLNLTTGKPMSRAMRERCERFAGAFPGKYAMVGAVLSGAVRSDDVEREWRAQIERCISLGIELRFLNSHEHVHMLPPLLEVTRSLASEYGIPHVRLTSPGWPATLSAGALVRSALLGGLHLLSKRQRSSPAPRFLGLDQSGRLDVGYFRRTLPTLRPGQIYELMCHPGRLDPAEVRDPRLLEYHEWETELAALTSTEVRDLLSRHNVRLVGYRDLEVKEGQLLACASPSAARL